MKRVKILIACGGTIGLPEHSDDNWEIGTAYLDLKEVQSVNDGESWNGQKTFYAYLAATSYTIVGDIHSFASEVEKVKNYHILGIN